MILAFAHPCLVVSDLQLASRFYQEMFGFQWIGDEGWSYNPAVDAAIGSKNSACEGVMLAGHNCFLELFEYSAPEQTAADPGQLGPHEPGIRHLAFYVDDCRAEFNRFISLGGTPLGEPQADENGVYVVYCRDPFGNIIELCEIPKGKEDPLALPGVNLLANGRK